jgi:hypothetical protein
MLPVVDEEGKLFGVVPFINVINLGHLFFE